MAEKIRITPAELQTQATEMRSLESEFSALFSAVTSELSKVNINWSSNLAHNFEGKIKSAQNSFSQITQELINGAKVADTCATTFESVDSLLAKNGYNKEDLKDAYGVATTVSSVAKSKSKSTSKSTQKKKKSFWSKMKEACIGVTDTVVTKTKDAISKAKKSYEEKGWAYDLVQYGKCALKVGKAAVKIAGSVSAIASGVGIPIAICGIISAGNDIVNACTDAKYTYTDQHDKVGTTNFLKDYLVDNAGYIGEKLGYRETGECVGELVYTGLDVVSFLNGADKMLKSLGKVNTVVTGTTGYSKAWGWTKYDDIFDTKLKFDFKADYFVRKLLNVDPTSNLNIIYEGIKNINSSLKSAWNLGNTFSNFIE